MRNPDSVPKVFVSSTSKDLDDYRGVARSIILDMGWLPVMMEHFEAMPDPTVEACYKKLKQCDLMILLVAFRRGWVPTTEQRGNGEDSVTALELNFAKQHNIPVLAFLASDDTWPVKLMEKDHIAQAWINNFREHLNLPGNFFNYELPAGKESERLPAFRTLLRGNLVSHRERLIQPSSVPPDPGHYFEGASMAITSRRCIPFLGHEVHAKGPLSTCSLTEALGDKMCHELCLASAAEYYERKLRRRDLFLSGVEKIIGEQAGRASTSSIPVYELLLKFKPPLIVNATEDLMLEEHLEASGNSLLILCHVIRSAGGTHDGKVLLFRGLSNNTPPEFCLADSIDLSDAKDAYVIYKPLGSPLLHHRLDPDLEIDTVVMTEADHLVFLSRLENQSTRVPTVFSRYFQRYPLIFLGYPMDVWQYRLVGHVFQSIGMTSKSSTSLAVRAPASRMEELAWHNLGADLLPMDPNEFARKVLETL